MSIETFSLGLTREFVIPVKKDEQEADRFVPIHTFFSEVRNPVKLPKLTDREMQILLYTAQGYKIKDISRALQTERGITLKSIFKKYHTDNATQTVSLAAKRGVLTHEMLGSTFDFDQVDNLTELQINILRELTTTGSNSHQVLGEKLGVTKKIVDEAFTALSLNTNLRSKPMAAAFYILAAQQGYIDDEQVPFIPSTKSTRSVPPFPGFPQRPTWKRFE